MDIAGDYVFDAPQQLVWDALQDPNVLGSIMPGGKEFLRTGDNQFAGTLEVKVGPVQGLFQGQIQLADVAPPESYKIVVDGKGAPGFVKATGNMHLEARDTQTFMAYSGDAQVGGRIASVGNRLIESAARSIIRQSLDALNEYLKVEAANQPPPMPAASAPTVSQTAAASQTTTTGQYKAPSQTGLTVNIMRDVLNDIVPPKYQLWLLGAIIAVIVLLIWLAAR
ncbi:MAG: carbon monoxide dehydrogenase subunit G [Burkholderiales bacterium]|nr:carbon monoxide dehydrogenase subunit G [Anaerolineae bacterium]